MSCDSLCQARSDYFAMVKEASLASRWGLPVFVRLERLAGCTARACFPREARLLWLGR